MPPEETMKCVSVVFAALSSSNKQILPANVCTHTHKREMCAKCLWPEVEKEASNREMEEMKER